MSRYTTRGPCHKCHTSGVQIFLTEVMLNEIGATEIPLCEKCRS